MQRVSAERTVFLEVQTVVARLGQPGHLRLGEDPGAVLFLEAPGCGILQHGCPNRLGLADPDGVDMFGRLLGIEERMRAAHDDLNPTAPEFGRDLVSARRVQGPGRERDHIGATVEIDILDLLVNLLHSPIRRGQRGKIRQDERHDGPAARLEHAAVCFGIVVRGLYNGDIESHAINPNRGAAQTLSSQRQTY